MNKKMNIRIISFTNKGAELSLRIKDKLYGHEIGLYTACSFYIKEDGPIKRIKEPVCEWCKDSFERSSFLVFIGAAGIAIRAIAPCIENKLKDPGVIVVDENGEYVIPILSGHVGGANDMALSIAKAIGGKAVITTATDVNNKFAPDVFAKKNNLYIVRKESISLISSRILEGKRIKMFVEKGIIENPSSAPDEIELCETEKGFINDELILKLASENEIAMIIADFENTLKEAGDIMLMKPRKYSLGIGCKKGKNGSDIEEFVLECLKEKGLDINSVRTISSIDIKKDEEGIIGFADKYRIPFVTFDKETLSKAEGDFASSDFVIRNVGIDNVCERAAVTALGKDAGLIVNKVCKNGMTLAVAKKDFKVRFYE